MTTTSTQSAFEHRYEAVENLVYEAARWSFARYEHQAQQDPHGNLEGNERDAAQDLADAIHEVALHGIEAHSDDLHVDATAAAMKQRLAEKRAAGYRGWNDPNECYIENLAVMLHRSLRQGKALDVANFAMMLHRRDAAPAEITKALSPWMNPPRPAADLLPHADLQGLRDALLAPRKILRDAEGWLTHPAMPATDEDVRCWPLSASRHFSATWSQTPTRRQSIGISTTAAPTAAPGRRPRLIAMAGVCWKSTTPSTGPTRYSREQQHPRPLAPSARTRTRQKEIDDVRTWTQVRNQCGQL
ncbi:hypothetical protein [Ralstonia solanacearum]|uniref:hypothetical protein n=1 Tax=Ralstonia solanacearum TaxID=305 RepID=UPI000F609B6B|nr:hypothetical protein [Ralstonia solanacearum]